MRIVVGLLLAGSVAACGAAIYFDKTKVNVYPRELTGYGANVDSWSRLVTEQWDDNLIVWYDASKVTDVREKRYVITVGKYVFDRYDRNTAKAVDDTMEKVFNRQKLCAKGWSIVSRGISGDGSGGLQWTVLCNELGT